MRKSSILLSMIVLVAVVLTACGGGATSTNVVESPPPVTVDSTDDISATATESPTDAMITTETPGSRRAGRGLRSGGSMLKFSLATIFPCSSVGRAADC